jgi:hypothetical protein
MGEHDKTFKEFEALCMELNKLKDEFGTDENGKERMLFFVSEKDHLLTILLDGKKYKTNMRVRLLQ